MSCSKGLSQKYTQCLENADITLAQISWFSTMKISYWSKLFWKPFASWISIFPDTHRLLCWLRKITNIYLAYLNKTFKCHNKIWKNGLSCWIKWESNTNTNLLKNTSQTEESTSLRYTSTLTADIKYDLGKHSSFERTEMSLCWRILFTFWFCLQLENQELWNMYLLWWCNMELGLGDLL